ncbi:MAG: hypothetical protein Q9227_008983 [Pyrenula ochraceoflavens]
MVNIKEIQKANAAFSASHHEPLVCVFAGVTSGIGAATLSKLAQMLDSPTFYILGRSASRFASQRAHLEQLNPNCKIDFVETDLSLLSSVSAACARITAAASKVDILYMSAGALPFNGPQCFAGTETSLSPKALSTTHTEANLTPITIMQSTVTLTTLSLTHLSTLHPRLTLLHAAPGLVRTPIFSKPTQSPHASFPSRLINFLATFILLPLIGITAEESGERQAYHLTGLADKAGPGWWLVDKKSEVGASNKVVRGYVEGGKAGEVWRNTVGVLERVLK